MSSGLANSALADVETIAHRRHTQSGKAKRALDKKEPKTIENTKKLMLISGKQSSAITNNAMRDLVSRILQKNAPQTNSVLTFLAVSTEKTRCCSIQTKKAK